MQSRIQGPFELSRGVKGAWTPRALVDGLKWSEKSIELTASPCGNMVMSLMTAYSQLSKRSSATMRGKWSARWQEDYPTGTPKEMLQARQTAS
jgi:hypothetical protein